MHELMKCYLTYKLMASDLFIKNALGIMNFGYRFIGEKVTNAMIGSVVGNLFTSGPNVHTLKEDIMEFGDRNVATLATFAREGMEKQDDTHAL